MMPDPEVGLQRLLKGLDRLELQCMVAGSQASSLHGIWRATNDVDLVVRLTSDRVDEFVAEFSPEYYIDADQVSGALRLGRPFNMIYLASASKFEISRCPVAAISNANLGAAGMSGLLYSASSRSNWPSLGGRDGLE